MASGAINGSNENLKNILVVASTFPSLIQPIHGVFVKERIRYLSERNDCNIRVVSPVPFFPPIPKFKKWYPFSQIPKKETIDDLPVVRPRYLLFPKIGAYFHSHLMFLGARKTVDILRKQKDFDIIDAHFVYPDGVAALMLATKFKKPLVITGRGEEILRFPDLPLIGSWIRKALKGADRLIALSDEIADAMIRNGADPKKIAVIPNGVDTTKYQMLPMFESRKKLNLPIDKKIVLSVGYRLERKGFHLLIDAVSKIRKNHPNLLLVIVGGPARWGEDYTRIIEERIRANQMTEHVILAGARPPEELPVWYSAADLFALLTSREGSPNVLMESLACGLPAVATPVGTIPQVFEESPERGILLDERTIDSAGQGITRALETTWDRKAIRASMEEKSWQATANKVSVVLDQAMGMRMQKKPRRRRSATH